MRSQQFEKFRIGHNYVVADWLSHYLYYRLYAGVMYSAGKTYGWVSKYSSQGVGINYQILKFAYEHHLYIRLFLKNDWNNIYEIQPKIFIERSIDHNAIANYKGVVVYIAPLDCFIIKSGNFTPIVDLMGVR